MDIADLRGWVESAVFEKGTPVLPGQQGAVRAQVGVLSFPIAVEHAEKRDQGVVVVRFDCQEVAVVRQQGGDVAQGAVQVAGGMEGVGGEDDVEAGGGEALVRGIVVQVEPLVVDEVVGGEPFTAAGEECR